MAHILLVHWPVGKQLPDKPSLVQLVEQRLRRIQPTGLDLPLTTHGNGGLVLGVLGTVASNGSVSERRLGLDQQAGRIQLALPGLTIDAGPHDGLAQADSVASRTLWYCQARGATVMSTSQRALIAWLGDVELAAATVGWFMITGSAGPGLAWDTRIRALPPAGTLRWSNDRLTLDTATPEFSGRSGSQAEQQLQLALEASIDELPRGPGVAFSLSGGLDSRVILNVASRKAGALRCVSWGAPSALDAPHTDASIARQLARHFDAPFRFLPIHQADADTLLDNYIAASEGRVDHIKGYLDGMSMWQTLASDGVSALVRGDEAFGWLPVLTAADVRRSVGAPSLDDFGNARLWRKRGLGQLSLPSLPAGLSRRGGESLPTWRDRLYQQFRIPSVLAALTNIKAGYVETLNPLLDERLLDIVRCLPDRDRTDKRFFRKLARRQLALPHLPFASADGSQALPTSSIARAALAELSGPEADAILPRSLREWLCTEAHRRSVAAEVELSTGSNAASLVRRQLPLPSIVRRVARNTFAREQLGAAQLLLRATLVCRTLRRLNADARASVSLQPIANAASAGGHF